MNDEGNYTVKNMPVGVEKVLGLMDQNTYVWHHDTHYTGYVNKRNEVEKELQRVDLTRANANYSTYRSVKVEETWNACGSILHEIYWSTMGGNGQPDKDLEIVRKIEEDFGSFEGWRNDFVACGKAARGWVTLSIDLFTDKKLRNFLYDFHNVGGVVGSIPLIAMDTYEHAYYHKYGPDRAAYIDALINNIDWSKVNEAYMRYKPLIEVSEVYPKDKPLID